MPTAVLAASSLSTLTRKRVLLLKAGELVTAARLRVGDYDRWFIEALGPRFDVVRVSLGERLPDFGRYDQVWMTGSPRSVTERAGWMLRAGEAMREAGERGMPVLGVCFGHQLLAQAYGSRVVKTPAGREIGTIDVSLTSHGRQDPLFAGLPLRFAAQATHEDEVQREPQGAQVLARSPHCEVQAFGVGANVRAVQFHPELSPAGMRAVVDARAPALEAEAMRGIGLPVRQLRAGIRPTPAGRRMLINFLEAF